MLSSGNIGSFRVEQEETIYISPKYCIQPYVFLPLNSHFVITYIKKSGVYLFIHIYCTVGLFIQPIQANMAIW